jgi:hypothetical protein
MPANFDMDWISEKAALKERLKKSEQKYSDQHDRGSAVQRCRHDRNDDRNDAGVLIRKVQPHCSVPSFQ